MIFGYKKTPWSRETAGRDFSQTPSGFAGGSPFKFKLKAPLLLPGASESQLRI